MQTLYSNEYKIAVECLQKYRLHKGITQADLAKQLGVSQTYVSNYEQAQKRLDIVEIRNICKCLDVTLEKFVSDFEEQLKKG